MAHHIAEGAQGAFTWTGPYGSGKSSLAVVLSALLNGNAGMRTEAASALGPDVDDIISAALPRQAKGWRVLPVVGRRGRPEQLIGEALNAARLIRNGKAEGWSQQRALDTLQNVANRDPRFPGEVCWSSSTKWAKFWRGRPVTAPISTSCSNSPRWLHAVTGV